MQTSDGADPPQAMHPASVLMHQILVLNDAVEFILRQQMDLNETDFQAMQHLITHRTMSPGELAKLLHLTAAATTTVIDRLLQKGHISRIPHPTDRRRWLISPREEAARAAAAKMMPTVVDIDTKVRSYDEVEQGLIVDFLTSVVTSMNDRISASGNHDQRLRSAQPSGSLRGQG